MEEREQLEEKIRHEQQKVKHAFMLYEFFKQAWADENNPLSYKAKPEIRATKEEAIKQLRKLLEKIKADGDLSWGEKSQVMTPGLIPISFNCFRVRTTSTNVSSLIM